MDSPRANTYLWVGLSATTSLFALTTCGITHYFILFLYTQPALQIENRVGLVGQIPARIPASLRTFFTGSCFLFQKCHGSVRFRSSRKTKSSVRSVRSVRFLPQNQKNMFNEKSVSPNKSKNIENKKDKKLTPHPDHPNISEFLSMPFQNLETLFPKAHAWTWAWTQKSGCRIRQSRIWQSSNLGRPDPDCWIRDLHFQILDSGSTLRNPDSN